MNLTADLAMKRLQGHRFVPGSKGFSFYTKSIEASIACAQFWGQHSARRKRQFHALYQARAKQQKTPKAGAVKDLMTTTIGAVVQPGSALIALMFVDEKLFADFANKNEGIGLVQTEQNVQIKLAVFPFQKYGLIAGKLVHVSADASDPNQGNSNPANQKNPAATIAIYKAHIALYQQHLSSSIDGEKFNPSAGMQVAVEVHQGLRTALECRLSPVTKSVKEVGQEK